MAARSVLFTEVSGKLMVNGKEAHGASFGQAPAVLLRRLSQRGITTLAIKEGVTPNELIRLLSALAREDIGLQGHKAWEAWLMREGLTHVAVGDRVYAAARRGQNLEEHEPTPAPQPVPEAAISVVEQVRRHLETGAEDPKPAVLGSQFLTQLEKLHLAQDRPGLEAATATLLECARAASPEVRRRAWSFAVQLTEKPPPTLAAALSECLAFPLEASLESETDEECLQRALVVAGRSLAAFVGHGSYVLANRILWGAFRRVQAGGSRGVVQAASQLVEKASALPELAILVEAAGVAEEGPAGARGAVCREFLLALGAQAVLPVLNALRRSDSLPVRRVLSRVLKDLGPQAEREIVKEIDPFGNPRELVRLFEVMEVFNVDPTHLVIAGFKHREDVVKRAAIDLLRRLPRERVASVLARAIEDEDPEVLKAAITAIGDLRPAQGVAWIGTVLKGAAPTEVKRSCCISLGKFDDESVVPLLVGVLDGGRSLLGLFGRKDDDVRASAAWALGHFRSPAAREALTRALKDSSPSVRSSAKMGLKG